MSSKFTPFDRQPTRNKSFYYVRRGIEVARFPIDEPVQFNGLFDEFEAEELMDEPNVTFYLPEPVKDDRLGIKVVRSGVLREANYHTPFWDVTLGGLVTACKEMKDSQLRKGQYLTFDRIVRNENNNVIFLNLKPSPDTRETLDADVDEVAALLKVITGEDHTLPHLDYGMPIAKISKDHPNDEAAVELAAEIQGITEDHLPSLAGRFAIAQYARAPSRNLKASRSRLIPS